MISITNADLLTPKSLFSGLYCLLYLAALVGVVVPGAGRAPLAPVPARAGRADAAAGVGVADVARLEAGRALGAPARREPPEAGQAGVAAAPADARAAVALPRHVVTVPVAERGHSTNLSID